MKANYLLKNRSKSSYIKKALILGAILVSGTLTFSLLDSVIISVISPLWRAENAFTRTLSNSLDHFRSRQALIEENETLKEQLASMEIRLIANTREQAQIETLIELLGQSEGTDRVAASVLSHPPQTPYDVLVIDAGSDESIKVDSEVALPEGPILGRISEVFPRQAKVKLFSATGVETSGVLERGSVPVMLVGAGGGNFKVKLPRDVEVEKGDVILSSDISGKILAIVESINIRSTDSFKDVLTRSPANIFTIRFVFVTP